MKSELIIDVHPDEIAIALTEDDRLQEIRREKRNVDTFAVGNIYYGRVKKVMPALNAVFVDVGYEKDAFLHYLDLGSNFLTLQKFISRTVSDRRRIPSMRSVEKQPECGKDGQIGDYLKVGDTLLVQVTKEPINTKGPRLTAEVSLAGRNMVLMPMGDKVMVSNKIRRDSERNKLRKMVQQVRPQGYGVIVRTVAEGASLEDLDSELNILVRKWEDALRLLQTKQPVCLICEEIGRTTGIIRDLFSPEFNTIQVNDSAVYDEVREYVELISPDSAKIVKLYTGDQPIFDRYDITRQLLRDYMNGCVIAARNGAVMVSPFISPNEKEVMEVLLKEGLTFIYIADNGFRDYYKPQDSLFDAVAKKQVLILSPWDYDPHKKHVSRAECVEMNKMAEEICGTATVATSPVP